MVSEANEPRKIDLAEAIRQKLQQKNNSSTPQTSRG